eukprot:SAG31_NODE_47564_length_235_cov_37.007353_1_plen_67_part_10
MYITAVQGQLGRSSLPIVLRFLYISAVVRGFFSVRGLDEAQLRIHLLGSWTCSCLTALVYRPQILTT